MGFFKKEIKFLGFDLSQKSIKVVELKQGGNKTTLRTYGGLEIPSPSEKLDNPKVQGELAKTINEVMERAHVSTRNVVASLPPQHVFNSVLSIPKVSDREMIEAVKWEAKQYIPAPLEEVIIDWKKIGDHPENKKTEVYLVAAPKKLISNYLKIYEIANVHPLALEIDPLAAARSILGDNQLTLILIDIGAYETNISVIEKGILRLCRTITSGGEIITKAIASNLNVDEERAEQFKKDFGIQTEKLEGHILKSVQPIINTLINEIKRSIEFHKTEGKEEIKKIVLTGGGSELPGLLDYLNQNLKIETEIGDPWNNISYPDKLTKHLGEIGPSFAVAVGLAMRKI